MAIIRKYITLHGVVIYYNEAGVVLRKILEHEVKHDMVNVENEYRNQKHSIVVVSKRPDGDAEPVPVPAPDQLAWHEKEITMPVKVKAATIALSADDVQKAIFEYIRREFPQIKPSDDLQTDAVIMAMGVVVTRRI